MPATASAGVTMRKEGSAIGVGSSDRLADRSGPSLRLDIHETIGSMGLRSVRALEVGPGEGRPGNDDALLVDDLVDHARVEELFALGWLALEEVDRLAAVRL